MSTTQFILGLMSGTSADGIDAALVEFKSERNLAVRATHFTPYDSEMQSRINTLAQTNQAASDDPELQTLDSDLAKLYARASIRLIASSGVPPQNIAAIANHGQTVAHRPQANPPESLQIGDGQRIADLTGLPVITQFRQADIAVGGQGAPLMPAFHRALISARKRRQAHDNILALNLGGIANISLLQRGSDHSVEGFDTGPANTLLNQWINYSRGQSFDNEGAWAAAGAPSSDLLAKLLADPYFQAPHPKSTGPDYFNLDWLRSAGGELVAKLPAVDVQATLLALTVESIAGAIEKMDLDAALVYACGGGVHNQALMRSLATKLPAFEIKTSNKLGVPADWVEAAGFAWLGYCYLHDIPSNLPSVTGASKEVILGEKFLPR